MTSLALLLVASAPAGPVRLLAIGPGGLKGTATLEARILPDTGGKYVRLAMAIEHPSGERVDVIQESTYDRDGAPIRMLQSTVSDGRRTAVSAVFDAAGATVSRGGSARRVPLPEGASPVAAHEFWFLRDRPTPGTRTRPWLFRLAEGRWVETRVSYEGTRTAVVGGREVNAHAVRVGDALALLDDGGRPYRLEAGAVVLERAKE